MSHILVIFTSNMYSTLHFPNTSIFIQMESFDQFFAVWTRLRGEWKKYFRWSCAFSHRIRGILWNGVWCIWYNLSILLIMGSGVYSIISVCVHDSYVTWLIISVCVHDSYVTWLICDVTHIWHDSYVTRLICDMTHTWHDA